MFDIAGEFVTGFDPTSKEAKYRRQMRMQRFGKHERIEKSKLDDSKISIDDENEWVNTLKNNHLFANTSSYLQNIVFRFTL